MRIVSCLNRSRFPFHASHPFLFSLLSPIPSLPSGSASASTFPIAPTNTPTERKSRGSVSLPAWIHGCNTPRPIHDPYTNTLIGETTLCMIEFHRILQDKLRTRSTADFSLPSELLQLQQRRQKLRFRFQQIA